MNQHICIISLALPIETDPRTGRQVVFLSQHFAVTLIGFGVPSPSWSNITWREVDVKTRKLRRLFEMLLLVLGRITPLFYEVYFWTRPRYRQSLRYAINARADAYHASDWATLAVAARAAKVTGAKVVFDIDEYWELFDESNRLWMRFFAPLIRYTMTRYQHAVDASITVSRPFAERFENERGWKPILATNAPDYHESPDHPTNPERIILIHHGSALRDRKLETMIDMIALADTRYALHFMIAADNTGYVNELKTYAEQVAPGRVTFRPPVTYDQVVTTIADADIGICFMAPTTYTWLMTLPNKIFESMMAGLAVLVAPSPSMAAVVREAGSGWVANDFTAQALADTLNALTVDDIIEKRRAAREAAKTWNAEHELGKIIALYRDLLAKG